MHTDRRTLLGGLAAFSAAGLAAGSFAQDNLAGARQVLAPDGPIAQALAALSQEDRFSGVAYASIEGRPAFAHAFGMANRESAIPNTMDTRFNIASMSKMFTAVAIGQLVERGRLGLDDPVVRHRPDLADALPERVTIAHLLSHTSGLGSFFASPHWAERADAIRTVEDYLALVREERIPADYDGAYRYSNSGFVVLGAVLERVTGRDFYEHLQAAVFAPASMGYTGYPIRGDGARNLATGYENGCFMRPPGQCTPRPWAPAAGGAARSGPGGGAYSTAGDLDAFAQALRGGRLVRRETFDLMKTARSRMNIPGGPLDGYGLGFGRLTVNGRATWGHNGGTIGWGAQMDCVEDAPINLIVLANQDGAMRPGIAALRRALA